MNILLTDIRSLTLDLQEIPEVGQGDGENFTHMLRQQLGEDAEMGEQVFEFKDFLSELQMPEQGPETVASNPPQAVWQDYLAQQQIRVTTDADPLGTIAADLSASPPGMAQPIAAANAPVVPETGDYLPASGNSLPPAAAVGDETPLAEPGRPVARPDPVLAQASSGQFDFETRRHQAQPGLDPAGAVDKLNPVAARAGVATLDSARIAASPASPETIAVAHTAAGVEAGPGKDIGGRANLPEFVTRPANLQSNVTDANRPDPVVPRDNRLQGQAAGVNTIRVSAGTELPMPPELAAAARIAAMEAHPGAVRASLRDAASVEFPAANELRDAVKIQAQPVKASSETAAVEFTARAGLDLTQPAPPNQAQPTPTALPVAGQGQVSAAVTPASAVVQNPLPLQLETLTVARNAEASEWGNGLGERVSWMINQKQNSATIRLDPPMLGKLDVQVKIADDATTIMIQTQHAQTRDLIETASVRLRDFLQENGYQNVNVDVSQRQDQQQARAQTGSGDDSGNTEESKPEQEADLSSRQHTRYFTGEGVLDTFA